MHHVTEISAQNNVCYLVIVYYYQAALADDVGKHVEEILGYIRYTIKVDPSGGLLCVQQVMSLWQSLPAIDCVCTFTVTECTIWIERS